MSYSLKISYEQADEIAIASMLEHLQYLKEDLELIESKVSQPRDLQDYLEIYDTAKSMQNVLAYYGKHITLAEPKIET